VRTIPGLTLDRSGETPLHRQIYEHLRHGIVLGHLPSGARVPSTRVLAQALTLSRNTVSRAYDQLLDEGYLEAKVGSGTRVSDDLPHHLLDVVSPPSQGAEVADGFRPLSRLGQTYSEAAASPTRSRLAFLSPSSFMPFSPAVPALDAFPVRAWERALVTAWRDVASTDLGYGPPAGYPPLREAIAAHMRDTRGVRCGSEQVIITTGTQQALALIAKVLLDPGDVVWAENPCFYGLHVLLRTTRSRVVAVDIDDEGLVVEDGIAKAADAKLAFVSPSHQYPLGSTMSLSRRLQLLRWAADVGAWIVEDDYDSEFRFSGYPLQALQGLDRGGRVIYAGTFSKSLFPALRLGYVVVPPSLVETVTAAQAFTDRGGGLVSQIALHAFMAGGQFDRHIRAMRLLYAKRQQTLLTSLDEHLADVLTVDSTPAGLHLIGWLPHDVSDTDASAALREAGIEAPSVTSLAFGPLRRGGLVLGYTTPEADLRSAARRMRDVLLGSFPALRGSGAASPTLTTSAT